jgi:hypothetical protein
MSRMGFEPMISVFKRAKAFHALGRVATVINLTFVSRLQICYHN